MYLTPLPEGLTFDGRGPNIQANALGEQVRFGDSGRGSAAMVGYAVEGWSLTFGVSNLATASDIEALPLQSIGIGPVSAGWGTSDTGWRMEFGFGARARTQAKYENEMEEDRTSR